MGKGAGGESGATTPRLVTNSALGGPRTRSTLPRFNVLGMPARPNASAKGASATCSTGGVSITASLGHATPRGELSQGVSLLDPGGSDRSSCGSSSSHSLDLSGLDLSTDPAAPLSSDITAVHSPAQSPTVQWSIPPSGDSNLSEVSEECPSQVSEECPSQQHLPDAQQYLVINGTTIDGQTGLPVEATKNFGAFARFMDSSHKDVAMAVQCLTFLGCLVCEAGNRAKSFRAGCVDVVVKSLREHKGNALVQEYGIWVLTMISVERRLALMVASLDGIKMACKAMKAFPRVHSLQQRAAWFLLIQLSWKHPAVLMSMKKRGALELLSSAHREFPDCKLLEKVFVDSTAMFEGRPVAEPLIAERRVAVRQDDRSLDATATPRVA